MHWTVDTCVILKLLYTHRDKEPTFMCIVELLYPIYAATEPIYPAFLHYLSFIATLTSYCILYMARFSFQVSYYVQCSMHDMSFYPLSHK